MVVKNIRWPFPKTGTLKERKKSTHHVILLQHIA